VSEKIFFRNRPTRNKNCLWQPCLFTDQDEISNVYRGPSIDASYYVSVHCLSGFRVEDFLEIDQSETRIACTDPGSFKLTDISYRLRFSFASFACIVRSFFVFRSFAFRSCNWFIRFVRQFN